MRKTLIFLTTTLTIFILVACSKTYKINFDLDGGILSSLEVSQTIKKDEKINNPGTPTKEGYTFLGWFLGDSKYDFDAEVQKNLTIKAKWEIIFKVEGITNTMIDQYDVLTAYLGGELIDNNDILWSSSNSKIATVIDGVVRYLTEGETLITAQKDDQIKEFSIEVKRPDINDLMNYFKATAKEQVIRETINLVGSDDGSKDYRMNFYPSVNNYFFNDPLNITEMMLSKDRPNHSNEKMKSLEWIVVHDTANTQAGALANANFMLNNTAAQVSWHYTVGPDGWFKSLEHDDVGLQAVDGGPDFASFIETNIPATALRPKMTISTDGYYEILGIKTDIKAPLVNGNIAKTSDVTEAGIWPVIIDGYYYIPSNKVAPHYKGKIVINGGSKNGIGIETSVKLGDDIFTTWHRTAKLVAYLLVENNLSFDRVVFHNHFANKPCPRTAMESDNWDSWLALMEFEYYVLKYFSDYTIEFESFNPTNLNDKGRVLGAIKSNSIFEYKITLTSPEGEVLQHTFSTLVNPK